MKKLYRSRENVIISGILGGIAEYLEIDPVVVRVVFILLTCITGFFPGIIFYTVSLFIIPRDMSTISKKTGNHDPIKEADNTKGNNTEQTISEDLK
jgi:phage shock protein C